MRRILLVLLTFAWLGQISACGGDSAPSGPDFPSVTNDYSGTWTLDVTATATGESASSTCPGSITIASQNQDSFSGSYLMQAAGDCDSSGSGNVSGTVRSDGGVTVQLISPSGDPGEFEDLTGCTVTSGDDALTGTISGGTMNVDAAFNADCVFNGQTVRTRWVFRFDGA